MGVDPAKAIASRLSRDDSRILGRLDGARAALSSESFASAFARAFGGRAQARISSANGEEEARTTHPSRIGSLLLQALPSSENLRLYAVGSVADSLRGSRGAWDQIVDLLLAEKPGVVGKETGAKPKPNPDLDRRRQIVGALRELGALPGEELLAAVSQGLFDQCARADLTEERWREDARRLRTTALSAIAAAILEQYADGTDGSFHRAGRGGGGRSAGKGVGSGDD